MGLFNRRKKVHVNVHGMGAGRDSYDGRYDRQLKKQEDQLKKRIEALPLETHTADELCAYITEKYQVEELKRTDERYKKAYIGVKAHLVETYRPDLLTPEQEMPDHPPESAHDEDYEALQENRSRRFKEAVMLKNDVFPMNLHVFNISIFVNDLAIAWLEVYIEGCHDYLAFNVIALEYEEHYSISRVRDDIIRYFGASLEDRNENNDRYLQYISIG